MILNVADLDYEGVTLFQDIPLTAENIVLIVDDSLLLNGGILRVVNFLKALNRKGYHNGIEIRLGEVVDPNLILETAACLLNPEHSASLPANLCINITENKLLQEDPEYRNMECLLQNLSNNPSLPTNLIIYLVNNDLGYSDEAIFLMTHAVQQNQHLPEGFNLSLCVNQIKDSHMPSICNMLSSMVIPPHFTLDLNANEFTDSGARLLAETISKVRFPVGCKISLEDNHCILEEGVNALIQAVENSPNIEVTLPNRRKVRAVQEPPPKRPRFIR